MLLRRVFSVLAFIACAESASAVLSGQTTQIKLGTLVPDGSIWQKALKQMGSEWSQGTGGRVSLVVFAGGTQGDEPTMVRKMRLGQLQAAGLTAVGLGDLDPAFDVFSVPFLFRSYDELLHVVRTLTPTVKPRLEGKGFHLLHWGHAGWVQVFTKQPVRSLNDLKQVKIYTTAGDDRMVQWYKSNGFQPVALAMTDIMTGLQTGMIAGMPSTPLAALSFQWFRQTPYMIDVGLAPLVGGTVMTAKAWAAISETDRAKVLEAAAHAETFLEAEVPKQDAASIAEMQKRGLTVIKIDASAASEFRSAADKLSLTMRGAMVPEDIYDRVANELAQFRKGQ